MPIEKNTRKLMPMLYIMYKEASRHRIFDHFTPPSPQCKRGQDELKMGYKQLYIAKQASRTAASKKAS
jgi:hypothetical protein